MLYFSIQLQSLIYIYIYIHGIYLYTRTILPQLRSPVYTKPSAILNRCSFQDSVAVSSNPTLGGAMVPGIGWWDPGIEQKKVSGLMVVPTMPWGHLFRFAFVWLIWCFFGGFRNEIFSEVLIKCWVSSWGICLTWANWQRGRIWWYLFLGSFSGEVSCRMKDQDAQELESVFVWSPGPFHSK